MSCSLQLFPDVVPRTFPLPPAGRLLPADCGRLGAAGPDGLQGDCGGQPAAVHWRVRGGGPGQPAVPARLPGLLRSHQGEQVSAAARESERYHCCIKLPGSAPQRPAHNNSR